WRSDGLDGHRQIEYTATVVTKSIRFDVDTTLPTQQQIPPEVAGALLADEYTQSDDPEITALADSLGLSSDKPIMWNIRKIYDYVVNGLKYVDYSGTTDALTAYHLGEASCGGKSRLMAALARHLGIPARLVGGKILSSGQTRTTHLWLEYYIAGQWVPFCPTNHYFAEIPSNYLILYYGEVPLLKRTKDINFKYYFNLRKRLVSTAAGMSQLKSHPLNILNVWATFKRAAISLELLRIIIMLPIGVLAVVLFRNLIGIETFGTFMPALIAIGFRDTGLWRGLFLFTVILLFGSLVRLLISRLQLLHTPRLAIILSFVVLFMLSLTAFGVQLGFLNLARVALFPMVILTLTVERFSLIAEESGSMQAVRVSLLTMLVAACAYSLMSWRLLQSIVISFPEAILVVVALYIYIGRYSGFRLSEYVRFRHLLTRPST
ncbi:MAG: transglutaminase, partial [Candidatus Zixiibacteriota bacterium]